MKITRTGAIWLGVGLGLAVSATAIYVFRKNIKNVARDIVNYVFSKEQEAFLKELHPDYQNKFRQFIADVERNTGYKVLITSGFRSFAKQAQLHLTDGGASSGKSLHNYGLATDLNLISKTGKPSLVKSSSDANWIKTGVVDIAKKYGLEWGGGGNFGSNHDPVHFQVDNLSVDKLYASAIKKFGSEKNVIGNQVPIAA